MEFGTLLGSLVSYSLMPAQLGRVPDKKPLGKALTFMKYATFIVFSERATSLVEKHTSALPRPTECPPCLSAPPCCSLWPLACVFLSRHHS